MHNGTSMCLGFLVFCFGVLTVDGVGHADAVKGDALCGSPGSVVGGWSEPSETSENQEGTTVRYFCEPKYLLLGSPVRVCTGGRWNGSLPVCAVMISLQNVSQSSTYGDETPASKAVDGDYATCASGDWDARSYWWYALLTGGKTTVAAVRITLPQNKDVFFGVRVIVDSGIPISCGRKKFNVGFDTTQTFICPRNTVGKAISITDLSNNSNYFQLCEVEVFRSTNLTCRLPDSPLNSHNLYVFNHYRQTYRYQCKEGFQQQGANETYCLNNGTWYPPAPVCRAITCPPLLSIANGFVSYNPSKLHVMYNDTTTYSCYRGFYLSGNPMRRCVAQDTWSGVTPQCLPFEDTTTRLPNISQIEGPKVCRPYQNVLNGQVKTEGTLATLICDPGYVPVKDVHSQCQANGVWQRVIFRCREVRCATPPNILNGQVVHNSEYQKLQIKCNAGYTLNPSKMVYCQSNGNWFNADEACLEVTCGRPPQIEGSLWSPTNISKYNIGITLTLECSQGFLLSQEDPTTIHCQDTGNWTDVNSTCFVLRTEVVQEKDSSSTMAMTVSFLIGVATTIAIIGVIAAFLICRRRQMTKHRSSQSIFHITHPYFASLQHPPSRISESAATETTLSEDIEDEHIYQVALYEPIPEVCYERNKGGQKCTSGHPTLQPCYSLPYENKRTLAEDFHIYAEPVDVRRHTDSDCVVVENSDYSIYSDDPNDNIYSLINERRCGDQQESYYPSSTMTTIAADTVHANVTTEMKDNDLYSSESEDDNVFA